MAKRLTYEEVKYFIEVESGSGCELLSKEYINNSTKLEIKCSCSNIYYPIYQNFKTSKHKKCDACVDKIVSKANPLKKDFNYVKEYIEKHNRILLSNTYVNRNQKLLIKCLDCDEIFQMTFASFRASKHKCSCCASKATVEKNTPTFDSIKSYFAKHDYELLSNEYINCDTALEIRCPKGHIFHMDFYHFKNRGQRCSVCNDLKDKSGENSNSWQGGITPLNHMLRANLKEWKFESLKKYNFQCIITGSKKSLHVHHIIPFNIIIEKILNELNISKEKLVQDYTDEEINDMRNMIDDYHLKNLGVPITKKYHRLFHSIYGYNTNEKDLTTFINDYKEGNLNIAI